MSVKRCCRTCKHFFRDHSDLFSLCQLRQIKIHTEISTFVFCHHWMKKEPNLPKISENHLDQQLDFQKSLISNEN